MRKNKPYVRGKLTYTCFTCGSPLERYASQVKTERVFCSNACQARGRKKPVTTRPKQDPSTLKPNIYYSAHAPGHPLATEAGRVGPHRITLYDSIGPGPHPCHWCGKQVDWAVRRPTMRDDLIVDHIDGNRRNNELANLVPACHRCNVTRTRTDLVPDTAIFIPRVGTTGGRRRAFEKACEHCGSIFLADFFEKRPNRNRFCSRSCARSSPVS